jgi:hypothetical protein
MPAVTTLSTHIKLNVIITFAVLHGYALIVDGV